MSPKPFQFRGVYGARLEEEDWNFSGRSETSRRTITASVNRQGVAKMKENWIYEDSGACRVGSKRVAFWHFSYCPPPNRACDFHRTRLSSMSFHLSFFLDDVKYIFDFLHYACLSVFLSDTPVSLRHVRGFPSLRLLWRLRYLLLSALRQSRIP